MAKRGRYTTDDNWYTFKKVHTPTYASHDGLQQATFVVDNCDVTEDNGSKWPGGAYRVRFFEGDKPKGFRAKTFIGETAWSDADRYANDWAVKAGRPTT